MPLGLAKFVEARKVDLRLTLVLGGRLHGRHGTGFCKHAILGRQAAPNDIKPWHNPRFA